MIIFIMRHAESYCNTQDRMMSATDLPLTNRGIEQANAARIYIENINPQKFTYAFCSPLLRARRTADIVVNNNADIIETAYLKEMDLGDCEGLTWDERKRDYPNIDIDCRLLEANFPNGERFKDIKTRCESFINESLSAIKESARVLIITHGVTARILTNLTLNRPEEEINNLNWLDNAAFTEIDYNPKTGTGNIIRLNERQHLTERGLGTANYDEWGLVSKSKYK